MKETLLFLFMLSTSLVHHGQTQSPNLRRLRLGDQMPSLFFEKTLNYQGNSLSLDHFKGKLLVLDFWSTWCVPCVKAFPNLENLQRHFGAAVQLVLITDEKKKDVAEFLGNRKKIIGGDFKMPIVCEDSILFNNLIKLPYLPTSCWIDKKGILRDITDGDSVNLENISRAINDSMPNLNNSLSGIKPTDSDGYLQFKQPFFGLTKAQDSNHLIGYSSVFKHVDELPPLATFWIDSNKRGYIFATNFPIKFLYRLAYSLNYFGLLEGQDIRWPIPYYENRTILQVRDSNLYVYHDGTPDSQKNKNLYTYHAMFPNIDSYQQLYFLAQADLKRFFGLSARVESRKLQCLVFSGSNSDKFRSKGGGQILELHMPFSVKLRNVRFSKFLSALEQQLKNFPPLLNEINYDDGVDIDLIADFQNDIINIPSLSQALKKYDITIQLEEREVQCLIVEEH